MYIHIKHALTKEMDSIAPLVLKTLSLECYRILTIATVSGTQRLCPASAETKGALWSTLMHMLFVQRILCHRLSVHLCGNYLMQPLAQVVCEALCFPSIREHFANSTAVFTVRDFATWQTSRTGERCLCARGGIDELMAWVQLLHG